MSLMGYRNADLVPLSEMAVPVTDVGLINGVIVSEQLRTFRSRPFLLKEHYERWLTGLALIGLATPISLDQLSSRLDQLISINSAVLTGEQGVCFFSTPGSNSSQMGRSGSTFYAYCYELDTELHRRNYACGVCLKTVGTLDVSERSWPKSVKIRSRLHYYLAQREVAEEPCPTCFPLLLDESGYVSDSSTASVVGWHDSQGLLVRPAQDRFSSVSIEFLIQLCQQLDIPVVQRLFDCDELASCSEILLASTPWCLYPVSHFNGSPTSGNQRGFPVFRLIMQQWQWAVACTILD